MSDQKLNEAATAAAKALQDKWSIGGYSRFCDDAPDFEPASTEEIARVIEGALSEALSSKELSGNSYVPEKPYGPNWNSVARDRFENGWLQK